ENENQGLPEVYSGRFIQPAAKRRHLVAPCVSAGSAIIVEVKCRRCNTGHEQVPTLSGLEDLFLSCSTPLRTWLLTVAPSGLFIVCARTELTLQATPLDRVVCSPARNTSTPAIPAQ